ncbi:hypothetical protein JBW_01047 [Pelosinus fermentans JBW45]|uniref:Uncharacterized protein n=1 Tax=Pelosinus fermentans JBW45 TaxID=1192197 RepID=I9NSZ2_9FIRM|nr:hypothetical protein JBW_01047 [Pelosinus fermentans JBW45]
MLQNVISKVVVNPDYSVLIQLKLVCLELVPRTLITLYRHIIITIIQTGKQLKLELLKYLKMRNKNHRPPVKADGDLVCAVLFTVHILHQKHYILFQKNKLL